MSTGGLRSLTGPMSYVAWGVALGWVALGVACLELLPWPWSWVGVGVAAIMAVVTTIIGFGLRVVVREDGLRTAGQTYLWASVDSIVVPDRGFAVPMLHIARGRGVLEIPLEGIGWAQSTARKLAEKLAAAGGVPCESAQATGGHRAARRAA